MSSSCRGVLIAGRTNRSRTQMAEAFLRQLSGGRVPVLSGGVHLHCGTLHPLAVQVMAEVGVPLEGHSVHTLSAARRQHRTYDVLVSVDHSPSDVFHSETPSASPIEQPQRRLYRSEQLFPKMPSHWSIGMDGTDSVPQYDLWSPADPAIAHERSTRKFQDHLYAGEPLFMRLLSSSWRRDFRVSERWVVPPVNEALPAERQWQHEQRFRAARELIHRQCVQLLRRLEDYYQEPLLLPQEGVKGVSGTGSERKKSREKDIFRRENK